MAADTVDERVVVRARTHVMSCDARIVVTLEAGAANGDRLTERAIDRLGELERRWSRFLPTSEISELNASPGTMRIVSPDTLQLVEALVQAWHATSGAFDPTLLATIVHLGYGASLEQSDRSTSLAPGTAPQGRPARILTRAADSVVVLPPGTTLDAGGLGKGLAADMVVAELLAGGASGALVEIGGDLRVAGQAPVGAAWPISIANSDDVIEIADGGVATSTSLLRTWTTDGTRRHHLIDPTSLQSTSNDVEACTVIASTGAWADAFTKIAFARGAAAALSDYEARGLAASITTTDGVATTSRWKEFLR